VLAAARHRLEHLVAARSEPLDELAWHALGLDWEPVTNGTADVRPAAAGEHPPKRSTSDPG